MKSVQPILFIQGYEISFIVGFTEELEKVEKLCKIKNGKEVNK